MTLFTSTDDVKGISPDAISTLITLPVEQASIAARVATIITTGATRTHIPLVTADPSASWVAEGAEIGASDPTLDDVVVEPAKIAGLTVITNELAADTSPAAAGIVGNGLSRDIARKIDLAFFGERPADSVQPPGLGNQAGVTDVAATGGWANLDPFAEAIANAEGLGAQITAFVANPADALILSTLKESSGSNKPLLSPDPTQPTRHLLQGVALFVSPGVEEGTIWGIPGDRTFLVRRTDVDLQVDRSAYFTSDRTAIRATMRVSWAFAHPAAIQRIKVTA